MLLKVCHERSRQRLSSGEARRFRVHFSRKNVCKTGKDSYKPMQIWMLKPDISLFEMVFVRDASKRGLHMLDAFIESSDV